jgi:chaperone BCS1
MNTGTQKYSIYLDENNIFITQKLLYYFEVNGLYPATRSENGSSSVELTDTKVTTTNNIFMCYGVMDVRGKRTLFLIPTFSITIPYKGTNIQFTYEKCQASEVDRTGGVVRMEQLRLSADSLVILKEFMYDIEKLEFLVPENKLIKYVWRESYWKYCNGFKRRKLDTLYLPKTYKNRVINEIEKFYNSESSIYESLCIPERKVFLFWGIPGSGKTTFIRAIASHFNKNIAIVKNTNDMDDASLESMLEELPRNSLILFEDIDSLFQGRSNVANTRITFSGLLNFLDGIIDYDKLLVFITTNNLQHIDDALRRRIDVFLEFTFIKKQEIYDMFSKFFADKYPVDEFYKKLRKDITPNALEKYFIRCLMESHSPLEKLELLDSYVELTKTGGAGGNLYM